MQKKFLSTAYLNKQWLPFENANISIATHALHYGTAAFGGLRAIPNPANPNQILLFRLDRHAKRLSQSAKFLGFDITSQEIFDTIREFVIKNKPTTPIYIRPLIYTSDLDLSPRIHDTQKDLLIYGLEMHDYLNPDGISCTVSSYLRQSDASFPLRGKITGGYITSAMAKSEAVERGFDEAILLNSHGKVSEASAMNIFIVRDGKIKTPNINEDILEGITRDSVIQVAKSLGYEVEEGQIDKTELFIADEVFLTGTAARVVSVKKIDNYNLPNQHPILDSIANKMTNIITDQDQEFADWVFKIDLI